MLFDILTFTVTFIAGLGTGLLGIGGAFIIYPCFLYIIPLLMPINLSVGEISGIATMQIVIGSFSGYLSHRHSSLMDKSELIKIAGLACVGTFTGGILSGIFEREVMLWLYFGVLVLAAFSMMKKKTEDSETCSNSGPLMTICIIVTGIFAGILGVGGAVLYIPILRYFKGYNTKQTIPASVFIVFVGAIMTFVGKAVSGQILYSLLPIVFLGAFSGAKIGALMSKKSSSKALTAILLAILISTAGRVLVDLLQ